MFKRYVVKIARLLGIGEAFLYQLSPYLSLGKLRYERDLRRDYRKTLAQIEASAIIVSFSSPFMIVF